MRSTPLAQMAFLLLLCLAVSCTASANVEPSSTTSPSANSSAEIDPDQTEDADPDAASADAVDNPEGDGAGGDRAEGDALGTGSRPVVGEAASDRIVVATPEGAVYLVDPDGSRRLDLVAETGTQGLQPVWSPDGRRIAWSERSALGFSIVSANIDGTERRRAETFFSGYYGFWDPTATQLGFLGNAAPGTGLVLDEGQGLPLDEVVDSDTFYYFSWSPDGTEWVVHSGSGLSIVAVDGSRRALDLDDSQFRAPTWTPNGDLLLGLRRPNGSGPARNVIALVDPLTAAVDELLDVGNVANFVLDPTGRFLAIESLTLGAGQTAPDEDGIAAIAFQPTPPRAELLIYDLATGESEEVLAETTGGFWWSPDGSKLATLVQSQSGPNGFVQWLVWERGDMYRTDPFRITPTYASSYVPFFDQFAQSVTPWAPDSSRFVYTGFDDRGARGVFVQPAVPGAAPELIADDGSVAFWSPT